MAPPCLTSLTWLGPAKLRTHPCPPLPPHDPNGMAFSLVWLLCACLSAPIPHTPPRPWPSEADTWLASFPRIGLSQLEGFRRQLLDVLQRSTKPKVSPRPLSPSTLLGHAGLWAPACPLAQSTRGPSHVRPGRVWLVSWEPRPIKLSAPPNPSRLPHSLSSYRGGQSRPRVGKGLAFAHTSCQAWDPGLLSPDPITQCCLSQEKAGPRLSASSS